MKIHPASAILLMGFIFAPAPAQAQPGFVKDNVTKIIRKVGVQVNMSVRKPLDKDVTKGTTFGGSVGLSPGRTNGWRYPVGFTTFSENLHAPGGEKFASLKSRAILGGIGYGWHFGKLSTGASLQTGVAFNHARLDATAPRAFDSPDPVSITVGNAWLLRPQLKAEYFITPKFTVRTSVNYMLTKPNIVVTTPTGAITDRWDASNVHANFGIGFYPFRK